MTEWLTFKTVDNGYRNKKTGRFHASLEGISQGEFEHLGTQYPDVCVSQKESILNWYELGDKLLLGMDITKEQADSLGIAAGFNAFRKTHKEATDMIKNIFGKEYGG